MPLNYQNLLPQIDAYAAATGQARAQAAAKLVQALALLRECGGHHDELSGSLNSRAAALNTGARCALLASEPADSAINAPPGNGGYALAASDGSQIITGGHEPLPIALINTSRLVFLPGSRLAPEVTTASHFLTNEDGQIELREVGEDLVSLQRDVEEMCALAEWENSSGLPAIALGDGPLELFHQPRSEAAFSRAFETYQSALKLLHASGAIAAGYTDRPRAALVVPLLELLPGGQEGILSGLDDLALFSAVLDAGQRSAVFALHSSSAARYEGSLALHFFYLNVSAGAAAPALARVEIPAWVAEDASKVALLHRALLEQCRLMGARPYPYLLHRAHECAVVSLDEKEQLTGRLAQALLRRGLGVSAASNKQSAKDLGSRRKSL